MIFVSESNSANLKTVSAISAGKPALTSSETNVSSKKGAGINFVMVDDKMKVELNKSWVEKQGLKVSGVLVSLSILVS